MPPKKKGYQGRHAAGATPAGVPVVLPNAPARPGTGGGTGTRRRGPQHGSGQTASRPVTGAAANSQRTARVNRIAGEARDYATREAIRRTEGPPSIVGRAAAGAAAGTATGAAVGGPPGAAVGAVIGGTGGALAGRKAKKAYKAAMASDPVAKRLLVAEFLVCMVVAALSPLTDRKKAETPVAHMKRLTAIMGLFFVLGLVSAAGRTGARAAAGFGGLVTVTLAISNRDLFMKIGNIFASPDEPADPEMSIPEYDDPDTIGKGRPRLRAPAQGRDHPGTMS